ncbi:N-acetyltransferase [Kitasatospora sp. MBT63]|uniref:GNAT family N-acetyltransferase n=1 Tax=Kitasatospora sp. MBT63 TaxID=1444768 RepID=UPI0013145475|nr:GNAT family N-acetyltransferase [Kitasatospora sp. MBT63]
MHVRLAAGGDAGAISDLLAISFMGDPVNKWIFPNSDDRKRLHPAFYQIFVQQAIAEGEVYIAEDFAAAALWLPMKAQDSSEERNTDPGFEEAIGSHYAARFLALAELMDKNHPRQTAHYYLPFIGVRPEHQGKGLGTALLQRHLSYLDAGGVPVYLEASNPSNERLYAQLGFELLGPLSLPGGPTLQRMWREPQPA